MGLVRTNRSRENKGPSTKLNIDSSKIENNFTFLLNGNVSRARETDYESEIIVVYVVLKKFNPNEVVIAVVSNIRITVSDSQPFHFKGTLCIYLSILYEN